VNPRLRIETWGTRRRLKDDHGFARINTDKSWVDRVVPLKAFYDAEDYHQDYAEKNPDNPYIQVYKWSVVSR
jgi:peptide methionine sulfoxide reductase MsrA